MVIVGSILLAFGIDALWDGVQERQSERDYIASIRDDLAADRVQLDTLIAFFEQSDGEIRDLLHTLDTPTRVVTDTLAFVRQLFRVGLAYTFTPATTTYAELTGGNDLSLASNRDFFRAVIDYHKEAELASRLDEQTLRLMWVDYFGALPLALSDPVLMADMVTDVNLRGTMVDRSTVGTGVSPLVASAVGIDLSPLRSSTAFRTALAGALRAVQVQLGSLRRLLLRCVAVLALAQEELREM